MATCCNATGGPAVFGDAKAALEDAGRRGIRVFRFFASLYGAAGKLWVTDPTLYWSEFDAVMDVVERAGLYCIPSIGTGTLWAEVANAVTPGLAETVNDVVRNGSSVGGGLQQRYFREIVARYEARESVLFWELGNELNLLVNLPPAAVGNDEATNETTNERERETDSGGDSDGTTATAVAVTATATVTAGSAPCGSEGCFNTSDMVAHTRLLVDIIRSVDPRRPISSGYSAGRADQWHMEHCPYRGTCDGVPGGTGGFWGIDTEEQWLEQFEKQNAAVDIMSLHHYMSNTTCYFNKTNCGLSTVALLTLAAERAASVGKIAYVGEYGGPHPNFTGPSIEAQSFPAAVLDAQVRRVVGGGGGGGVEEKATGVGVKEREREGGWER